MQTYCICVQSIFVLPFAISGWFWIAFENLLSIFCCWNTFRSPVMDIKSYISTLSKIGQWTDRNRIELGIIGSINKPTPPYDVWLTLHFAAISQRNWKSYFHIHNSIHVCCKQTVAWNHHAHGMFFSHQIHTRRNLPQTWVCPKFDPEDITWVPGNGLCFPTTARKVELKCVLIFQCLSCNERKLSITKVWWSANQWIV